MCKIYRFVSPTVGRGSCRTSNKVVIFYFTAIGELPKVDWPGVGLAILEAGIIEGSLGGKVGLGAPISDCGT